MNKKVKVGIIGTGNIGCDLLVKIRRSKYLECGIFIGKNRNSDGIRWAKSLGVNTSYDSINTIISEPDSCEIVFDATSAENHKTHAPILKKLRKYVIDMTPSKIGLMCIPVLNLSEGLSTCNVNMVTCGGQATTPLINGLIKIHPECEYVEIVASISSRSAGIGTRNNIDEYTQTTSDAIKKFTGVKNAKAIIILNPADPPIVMHNTIYAKIKHPKINAIEKELTTIAESIRQYVPGYKLTVKPVVENGRLTFMNEVIGKGDFLPTYAGNLDIINSAGILVAEEYAKRKI